MKSKVLKKADHTPMVHNRAWDRFAVGHLKPGQRGGRIVVLGTRSRLKDALTNLAPEIPSWQISSAKASKGEIINLTGHNGPILLVQLGRPLHRTSSAQTGGDASSPYAVARDVAARALVRFEDAVDMNRMQLDFVGESAEQRLGFLVGIALVFFQFSFAKNEGSQKKSTILVSAAHRETLDEARRIACAMNIARYLVNLPANHLSPQSYAVFIKNTLPNGRFVTTKILTKDDLIREKMGLLLGVGQGSRHAPAMVHIRYRPKGEQKPTALVGKGITFDTGGLDMKTSTTMRSMKKDMAGSAALVGLAHYWISARIPKPFDIYLPLAENRIDGHSLCPGDIVMSRKGLAVEISNTDAEGRLLLADACHYAATRTGKDRPALLIDVATLTGAAKVALGPDLMALFCNDEKLAARLAKAAFQWGDPLWRLPLHTPYGKSLKSPCADLQNCASSPLGGAITAALFVQRFTEGLPWAHLDIMAWAENLGGNGAITSGANGQAVQCLIGLAHLL